METLIAEYIASQNQDNQQAQEEARKYREAAEESAKTVAEDDLDVGISQDFKPSENLKKLYREAAKLVHPDLTTNEKEQNRRHHIMADINQAYQNGDEEKLVQILHNWECSPESVEGEGVEAELIRVIRKINLATTRLEEIREQIEAIKNTELYLLRAKMLLANENGRDILAEMALDIEVLIMQAKERYNNLCKLGGKKLV